MIDALIVDDESLVRKGLRIMLPWEQHEIRIAGEAASAEKALEFMSRNPVQLLVLDITMPGMSGLELMQRLLDENSPVKVVILTCHQDFDYIQQALRLGAVDYIVKTQLEDQDLDALLSRIAAAVNTSGAHRTGSGISPEQAEEAMEERMRKLLWVLNDEAFEALAGSINAMDSGYDWPAAAVRWSAFIQRAFPVFPGRLSAEKGSPAGRGSSSAADAEGLTPSQTLYRLSALRKELQGWLRASGYSEEILRSIVRAAGFILDYKGEPVKQSGLAKEVSLSQSYFSICFKEIMRLSFTHYMQLANIERAKILLATTNQPIYWIAEQCGFTDQRYFSRIFKELAGMLPSEFKQTLDL